MRLRRVEPVLRRALAGPCAVEPGERVLVAVSGGADSTALLLGLVRLAPEFGYEVAAAHLHHGLRGAEADGDLAFVRGLCERLGIRLAAARWDTKRRMRRRGLTGQEGLRRLRREFLALAARRMGAAAIATAHTADDQLETLLLRLSRGTGLRGLGGIAPRNGSWIRPLLEAPRAWIEADLRTARQPWREDASNRDPRYARNRARHVVIPALMALSPGASRAGMALKAAAAAGEARGATTWLDRRIRAIRAIRIEASCVALDCSVLRPYPAVIRQWAVRRAWGLAGAPEGLTGRHLEQIGRLMTSSRAGRASLPGGMAATRASGLLRIHRSDARIEPVDPQPRRGPGKRVPERDRSHGFDWAAVAYGPGTPAAATERPGVGPQARGRRPVGKAGAKVRQDR